MMTWRTFFVALLLAALSSPAWAQQGKRQPPPSPTVRHAPELDSAGFGSVAAILVGATFLFGPRALRRRDEAI